MYNNLNETLNIFFKEKNVTKNECQILFPNIYYSIEIFTLIFILRSDFHQMYYC